MVGMAQGWIPHAAAGQGLPECRIIRQRAGPSTGRVCSCFGEAARDGATGRGVTRGGPAQGEE